MLRNNSLLNLIILIFGLIGTILAYNSVPTQIFLMCGILAFIYGFYFNKSQVKKRSKKELLQGTSNWKKITPFVLILGLVLSHFLGNSFDVEKDLYPIILSAVGPLLIGIVLAQIIFADQKTLNVLKKL